MIPGVMVIEKVHGLQCTGISLSERFALMMAEHRARVQRIRKRAYISSNQVRTATWGWPSQMTLRMSQPRQQPIRQRLGMPGLRRFGSDGNLPGLQRSNSFSNISQFRNRIPWRQSNSNLSRAGSVSNLSQASWHGGAGRPRARSVGPFRGRMRGRGRQQQPRQVGRLRQQGGRAALPGGRGAARGRGGVARNQQNRNQNMGNQQNRNQFAGALQTRNLFMGSQQNRNQLNKPVPTKEELDAQLDEYMASSQFVLDKELEEYMLKGALMEVE